jgi:hypothetical protein
VLRRSRGYRPNPSLAEHFSPPAAEFEHGIEPTGRIPGWSAVCDDDWTRRIHVLTVEFGADCDGGTVAAGDDEVLEARWFASLPELDPFVVEAWRGR